MTTSPKHQLQQLIELQNLDDEIADRRKSLAEIPLQVDGRRAELEERKKILTSAEEELSALQKKRRGIESEVQKENDHMKKAKVKLPAIKTNKEYTAILSEVAAAKEKVSRLEDEELAIMETLEEKEKEFPRIKKIYEEEDVGFREYKNKKDAELDRIKQELSARLADRENISGQLAAAIMQRYEKVAGSREGKAVVSLRGNICQGCFRQILPQMVIDVKVGASIQQCSNCIRFLYWDDQSASDEKSNMEDVSISKET